MKERWSRGQLNRFLFVKPHDGKPTVAMIMYLSKMFLSIELAHFSNCLLTVPFSLFQVNQRFAPYEDCPSLPFEFLWNYICYVKQLSEHETNLLTYNNDFLLFHEIFWNKYKVTNSFSIVNSKTPLWHPGCVECDVFSCMGHTNWDRKGQPLRFGF